MAAVRKPLHRSRGSAILSAPGRPKRKSWFETSGVILRFVLIDQSIRSLTGHHYEYAVHVLGVAEKAGYRPVLAANRRFTGDPKWNGFGESGSWDVASFAFNWRRTPPAELVA